MFSGHGAWTPLKKIPGSAHECPMQITEILCLQNNVQILKNALNNILFDRSQGMLWKYIVEVGSDIKLWGLLW